MFYINEFIVIGNQVLTGNTATHRIVVAQLDSEQAAIDLMTKLNQSMINSLQEVTEPTEASYQVLPLDTKFNWKQTTYPRTDDETVYVKFGDGYHAVEPLRTPSGQVNNIKDLQTQKYHKVKDLQASEFFGFYGDVIVSEVVEDTKFTANLEKDALDRQHLIIKGKHNIGGHQQINILVEEIKISDIDSLIKQLEAIKDKLN